MADRMIEDECSMQQRPFQRLMAPMGKVLDCLRTLDSNAGWQPKTLHSEEYATIANALSVLHRAACSDPQLNWFSSEELARELMKRAEAHFPEYAPKSTVEVCCCPKVRFYAD